MELSKHGNQTLIWFMTSMKIRKSLLIVNVLEGVLKLQVTEAFVGRCSSKHLFLKISQYLQENTCVGLLQAYSIKYFNY